MKCISHLSIIAETLMAYTFETRLYNNIARPYIGLHYSDFETPYIVCFPKDLDLEVIPDFLLLYATTFWLSLTEKTQNRRVYDVKRIVFYGVSIL